MEKIEINGKEEFRDIKGYEGHYQVSNLGRVKSLQRKFYTNNGGYRILKEKLVKLREHHGYQRVKLWKNQKAKLYAIHRLVYQTFVGDIIEGMEIDHIDTNRSNNNVSNLRMVTPKENRNNPLSIQHYKKANKINGRKSVKMYDKQGALINVFVSLSEAAEAIGGIVSGVGHCCRGDFPLYKGYKFEYNLINY